MSRYSLPVSVIMPCYNSALFIHSAIQSILTQSFCDLELIIVDDGSTDSTVEIIQCFTDPRIRLVQLENNHGNYFARNIGLNEASGKYIAMLDSDDVSESNRIEIQYQFLQTHKSIGAIGSNYTLIDSENRFVGKVDRSCSHDDFKIKLLQNNYMLHSTIMIRRHLIHKYNLFYNLDYKVSGDYDFVVRCSMNFRIFNIPDYLVKYRFHDNQLTKQKMAKQIEYSNLIRKTIFLEFGAVNPSDYSVLEDLLLCEVKDFDSIKKAMEMLNKVILANKKKKRYNNTKLEQFCFNAVVTNIAILKNVITI